MQSEQAILSFLSIISLISFFVTLMVHKTSDKINNGILLDQDFDKPQAFHKEPVLRSGGLAVMISMAVFIFVYYFLFGRILNDYFFLSIALFSVGFLEDVKFRITPKVRLALMIIILSLSSSLPNSQSLA